MAEKTYKNFQGGLEIKEEFSKFIPAMSRNAFETLTNNIKNDGYIRDALVTWNNIILDGHHRYKIAESLDMPFEVREKTFESMDDAQLWMLDNQVGSRRMSTDQLAIFALGFIPVYRRICKERQKKGGTLKTSMGKNLKTSELVAKKVGVNEKSVIQAKYLKESIPEILPLIKDLAYEGLTLIEAKALKLKQNNDEITIIVADGKLSEEAELALDKMREKNKPKTEQGKAVKAAETASKNAELAVTKAKETNPNSEYTALTIKAADKAADLYQKTIEAAELVTNAKTEGAEKIAMKAVKEAVKNTKIYAKDAKEAADKVIKPITGGDTDNNENKSGVITNDPVKLIEGDRLKRYINDTKIAIQAKFGDVSCMDKMEDTEKQVTEIISCIAEGIETQYNENIVLIVPTNQTHATWCQKASSLARFFCDSSEHPVRLLYFGSSPYEYHSFIIEYGITSVRIGREAEELLVQDTAPKQITSPGLSQTHARTGKKPAKTPLTPEALLKRVKAKKAPKKTKK